MKSWLLMGFVAGVVGAQAQSSYELLLVADHGTRSVHRFDPMTGRSLGQFGTGQLTGALDVAVDASTGEAHVHEGGGRILRFDYSTGLYRGRWNVNPLAIGFHRAQNGMYLAWTDSAISLYRADLTFDRSFAMPMGVTINGADIAANGGAGFLWVGTSGSQGDVARQWDLANNQNTANQFWLMNRIVFRANIAINTYRAGLSRIIETDSSQPGIISNERNTSANQTLLTMGQPSWGHAYPGTLGWGYVPGRNAANTGGLVVRYDADYGLLRGTFGEGILNDPRGSATVLAPEPGTMIALGLGLAGLVVKRRRRR